MSTVSEREKGGVRLLVGGKVRLVVVVVCHRKHVRYSDVLSLSAFMAPVFMAAPRLRSIVAFAVGLPPRTPFPFLVGHNPWLGIAWIGIHQPQLWSNLCLQFS